jgi:hypothetical protein
MGRETHSPPILGAVVGLSYWEHGRWRMKQMDRVVKEYILDLNVRLGSPSLNEAMLS